MQQLIDIAEAQEFERPKFDTKKVSIAQAGPNSRPGIVTPTAAFLWVRWSPWDGPELISDIEQGTWWDFDFGEGTFESFADEMASWRADSSITRYAAEMIEKGLAPGQEVLYRFLKPEWQKSVCWESGIDEGNFVFASEEVARGYVKKSAAAHRWAAFLRAASQGRREQARRERRWQRKLWGTPALWSVQVQTWPKYDYDCWPIGEAGRTAALVSSLRWNDGPVTHGHHWNPAKLAFARIDSPQKDYEAVVDKLADFVEAKRGIPARLITALPRTFSRI